MISAPTSEFTDFGIADSHVKPNSEPADTNSGRSETLVGTNEKPHLLIDHDRRTKTAAVPRGPTTCTAVRGHDETGENHQHLRIMRWGRREATSNADTQQRWKLDEGGFHDLFHAQNSDIVDREYEWMEVIDIRRIICQQMRGPG